MKPNVITLDTAFERHVTRGAGDDACWGWSSCLDGFGYGLFRACGKVWRAHRASWTIAHGDIPNGMCVLHTCDDPTCSNPRHLFLGTRAQNNADRDQKGRHVPLRGEAHGMAKLTDAQIESIQSMRGNRPAWSVARRFDVSVTHVWRIWNGESRGLSHE